MIRKDIIELFRVPAGKTVRLKDYNPGWAQTEEMEELGKDALKERARQILDQNLADLAQAQELLYADDRYSVLIVLQAMDAAGKDGTIKHVMSGVNPQGCQVFSFKKPSAEELDHNFLWRYMRCLPERGRIGIFNRSYYEDVLVVKVHPELLAAQRLPGAMHGKKFWQRRYQDINAFERHLVRNGTVILKFFLNVSKEEQKRRFLERLDRPEKNWKFSSADLAERAHWGRLHAGVLGLPVGDEHQVGPLVRGPGRSQVGRQGRRRRRHHHHDPVAGPEVPRGDRRAARGPGRSQATAPGRVTPRVLSGIVPSPATIAPTRGGEHETGELHG